MSCCGSVLGSICESVWSACKVKIGSCGCCSTNHTTIIVQKGSERKVPSEETTVQLIVHRFVGELKGENGAHEEGWQRLRSANYLAKVSKLDSGQHSTEVLSVAEVKKLAEKVDIILRYGSRAAFMWKAAEAVKGSWAKATDISSSQRNRLETALKKVARDRWIDKKSFSDLDLEVRDIFITIAQKSKGSALYFEGWTHAVKKVEEPSTEEMKEGDVSSIELSVVPSHRKLHSHKIVHKIKESVQVTDENN